MTEYVKTFSCPTCSELASGLGHLCHPVKKANHFTCEFCNKTVDDARHVCSKMIEKMEYICRKCGRVAIYDSLLCEPDPISQD